MAARRSPPWYDLARREGAQPALDELVEPDEVHVELQRRVRDEAVGAVRCLVTTGEVYKAEKRSDNKDPPVATDSKDPLHVCDRCRHGDLVGHDELTHHMVFVVFQLRNLRNNTIAIRLAE